MDFLALCKRTRELAGIAGTGPSTVIGQTGELGRLVNWVAKSWIDIQNLHKTWNFLITDLSFDTVAHQGDYTLAQMGASTLRQLDRDSLRCQTTSIADRQFLDPWDWVDFRDVYRFNHLTEGRPIRFAVDPKNKSLCLAAVPDGVYTITGRYYSKPVELVYDADTPAMPDEYHMLIVYWALSKYAGYESAPEAKAEAVENNSKLLSALVADQLPDITVGGGL